MICATVIIKKKTENRIVAGCVLQYKFWGRVISKKGNLNEMSAGLANTTDKWLK